MYIYIYVYSYSYIFYRYIYVGLLGSARVPKLADPLPAQASLATSTTLVPRPTWPNFSSDPLDDQINLAQIRTRSSSRSGPPCSNFARSTERPGLLSHRRSVPCVGPCPLLARTQSVQVLSSNFSAQVYLINFSDSSCGTRSTLRPDPLWDHSHFTLCMYMHSPTPVYIYIYIIILVWACAYTCTE